MSTPEDPRSTPTNTDTSAATSEDGTAAAGSDTTTADAAPEDPVVSLILRAREEALVVRAALGPIVQGMKADEVIRLGIPHRHVGPAVRTMSRILRDFPSVLSKKSPAALDAGVNQVDALQRLEDTVSDLLTEIHATRMKTLHGIWKDTRDIYLGANREAESDKRLDQRLEPLRALFKRAPPEVAAPVIAADEARKAANAADRAAKAAQRAAVAHERAVQLGMVVPAPTEAPPNPGQGGGSTPGG